MSEKFPKTNRILKRERFRTIYEQGRKVSTKFFTAFVLQNAEARPRLGLTVTRKTAPSVGRNRARRLLREVFRKNQALVPAAVDIVLNVKKSLLEAGYREVEEDFVNFLKRIGHQ